MLSGKYYCSSNMRTRWRAHHSQKGAELDPNIGAITFKHVESHGPTNFI